MRGNSVIEVDVDIATHVVMLLVMCSVLHGSTHYVSLFRGGLPANNVLYALDTDAYEL